MEKKQIISICEAMGFNLDYDQFEVKTKNWMRFQLKDELDEQNLRWIWHKNDSLEGNISRGASILFKAGQKAKIQQLKELIEL